MGNMARDRWRNGGRGGEQGKMDRGEERPKGEAHTDGEVSPSCTDYQTHRKAAPTENEFVADRM